MSDLELSVSTSSLCVDKPRRMIRTSAKYKLCICCVLPFGNTLASNVRYDIHKIDILEKKSPLVLVADAL